MSQLTGFSLPEIVQWRFRFPKTKLKKIRNQISLNLKIYIKDKKDARTQKNSMFQNKLVACACEQGLAAVCQAKS